MQFRGLQRLLAHRPHQGALLTIGFFLMLRSSNLVPKNCRKYNPNKQFSRDSLVIRGELIFASISWTKTIQFGQRKLVIPLLPIKDSPLCPVAALKNLAALPNHSQYSPWFISNNGQPILYSQLNSKIKSLIKRTGLNPKKYSTHSLRRGGATVCFQAGIPGNLIQLHGDWASDAYLDLLTVSSILTYR